MPHWLKAFRALSVITTLVLAHQTAPNQATKYRPQSPFSLPLLLPLLPPGKPNILRSQLELLQRFVKPSARSMLIGQHLQSKKQPRRTTLPLRSSPSSVSALPMLGTSLEPMPSLQAPARGCEVWSQGDHYVEPRRPMPV
jgi:hypothetical protein